MGALELRAIGIVALVLGVGFGLAAFIHYERGIGRTEVQQRWDAERAAVASAASAEAARQVAAQAEVARLAQQARDHAQADADSARSAADRLRVRYDQLLVSCGASSAATPSSDAASSPIGMLADVFQQVTDLARRYAQIADERGIAGAACERAYEALIK